MFIWAGDAANPYPSDAEILDVARLGYNVFQMHRLGTPGLPRGPEGELDRVIKSVHAPGMLFQWTENADLMYAKDPKVVEMVKGRQVEAVARASTTAVATRRAWTPTATRSPRAWPRPTAWPSTA